MDARHPKRRDRPVEDAHEKLIDRALEIYQPRTQRQLSREDGREIIHNLAGFLGVLSEWKRRERAAAAAGESR